MQVYKTFFKISLRFFPSVIVYLVIYAVLSFVIPNATKSDGGALSFEAEKLKIAVVDKDNSTLSQGLYDYLHENHKIQDIGTDESTWPDELYYQEVVYILVIEEGMEEKALAGNFDNLLTSYESVGSNSSYIVDTQVETYMTTLKGYVAAGYSPSEIQAKTSETVKISAEVSFNSKEEKITHRDTLSLYFTYFPYIMICMMINSLGPMLIIWNRKNVKMRTSVSGTPLIKRTGELILAAITYALFVFALFIGFAIIAFNGDIFTLRGAYYILNAVIFLLVSVAITLAVSQICKEVNLLNMWSNLIGLSTAFMSGIFVQRSLLPDGVVNFSKCMPTYWYVSVTEELAFFNGTISNGFFTNMIVQLLFAVALFGISLVISKIKERN